MSPRPTPAPHRITLRDGLSVNVLEYSGELSPPLLFIHGSFGHAHLWDFVIEGLSAEQRCYAMDLLGHGESEHAPDIERYELEKLAQDVNEVVDWIGSPPVLGGHSVGSAIAMMAAGVNPGALAALILMDIDPFPPDHQAVHLREVGARPAREYETFEHAVGRETRGAPDAASHVPYHMATHGYKEADGAFVQKFDQGFLRELVTWDTRALLPTINIPALVLRGAESTVHSPEGYETLLSGLPNSRGELIPDATHQLHLDQPAAVGQAITRFMNEMVSGKG